MKTAGPEPPPKRPWLTLKRRIFPRGLTFTREGKVYVGVTLGVGFGAINTGNNLLFLVLGLMLGLIIVSGILSEVSIRKIQVSRRVPRRVESGVPFSVELALSNTKRWAASFGVELRDEIDNTPFRRRCFFLRVGPNEERKVAYRCELKRRGKSFFQGTIISTRFPFGLFEKRRFVTLQDEIIVLPARLEVSAPMPFAKMGDGAHQTVIAGPGGEYRELREMVHGDDPRRIHWRSTARYGQPLVRETDADAKGFIEVVLDPLPKGQSNSALDEVERNIEAAGTLVRDLTRLGLTVRLVTSSTESIEANSRLSSMLLLEHLALIDPLASKVKGPPKGVTEAAVLIGPRAKARGRAYRMVVPRSRNSKQGNGR